MPKSKKVKVVKIKVFTYDQLSDEAKETAREWYLGNNFDYAWSDEWRQSLEEFCKVFPITVKNWEVDDWNHSFRLIMDTDDNVEELSGIRLRTYILNNYYSTLFERKHYGKYAKNETTGKWKYQRYSRCQWIETDCPFTGYCGDYSVLQPIREFLKTPKSTTTFKDLMDDCIESLFTDWQKDMEWQRSEEYVADHLEANGYEFDEYGNRFTAPYDKKAKKKSKKAA